METIHNAIRLALSLVESALDMLYVFYIHYEIKLGRGIQLFYPIRPSISSLLSSRVVKWTMITAGWQ